jgi:hypothetical protein
VAPTTPQKIKNRKYLLRRHDILLNLLSQFRSGAGSIAYEFLYQSRSFIYRGQHPIFTHFIEIESTSRIIKLHETVPAIILVTSNFTNLKSTANWTL